MATERGKPKAGTAKLHYRNKNYYHLYMILYIGLKFGMLTHTQQSPLLRSFYVAYEDNEKRIGEDILCSWLFMSVVFLSCVPQSVLFLKSDTAGA